jgi:LuxR family maltose regulon positive regulatory protein
MSRALALVDSSDESRNERPFDASPLLETKLYVPSSLAGLVARPRLTDALQQGAAQRLTVVIAPAGFGKTTLLAGWLREGGRESAAAWVSLDPSENDPALFWAYFIHALQRIQSRVGTKALALLQSPHAPVVSVLSSLINDVDASDTDFTVVLDDYHVIDSAVIHSGMTFLLDHLPRRMHLVIASRSEPPLPLPRLRARGELTELRAADLRFTSPEAAAFLNDVMALGISRTDSADLERRTEGWIAGLKLSALSLKSRGDVRGFVNAFSGENRYIADYLVEEVLQSEPEHIRRFLLATAILNRMSGSICDAVTGAERSQVILDDLQRRGLFVVSLDDRGEWFRYHHLFADVLQKLNKDAGGVRDAHRRASAWYEQHRFTADAVQHALEAQDLDSAARLLEESWPGRDRSYDAANWLERVKTLPEEALRIRPVLTMGYAWGLLNSGELEAAEPRLRDVERWLQAADGAPAKTGAMIVSDEKRFQSLATELAAARVYLTQSLGDVPGTLEHAQRALELTPADDVEGRVVGTALVALALWGRGDLEAAHRTFTDALAQMRKAGRLLDYIRGIFVLGDIRVAQGRLRDAAVHYEKGLQLAADTGPSATAAPETDELYLGLCELHREWNDLAAAAAYLDRMVQSADRSAHKGNMMRWHTAMAALRVAQGDAAAALESLDAAERHERRDPLPRLRPIPAMKARLWLGQGRVEDAMAWVTHAKVSIDDDLSYLREYEHVTLARTLVARSAKDALRLLERLQVAAQTGGRIGSVIEILVLQSLAQHAVGNSRGALDALREALALAEPEGYLRVFLDEGPRLRDLLRAATARGLAGPYTPRVLLAFDAPRPTAAAVSNGESVQPLTNRELEILRLIASGLRNQEIADTLSISAATVKRHIANAYGKLGAGHRTEALARAKELKLL